MIHRAPQLIPSPDDHPSGSDRTPLIFPSLIMMFPHFSWGLNWATHCFFSLNLKSACFVHPVTSNHIPILDEYTCASNCTNMKCSTSFLTQTFRCATSPFKNFDGRCPPLDVLRNVHLENMRFATHPRKKAIAEADRLTTTPGHVNHK